MLTVHALDTAETTQKGCPIFRAIGSAKFSMAVAQPTFTSALSFPFPKLWPCFVLFFQFFDWLVPSPDPEDSGDFLLVSSIIHFLLLSGSQEAYPQSRKGLHSIVAL